jgi:bifunctional enzyme CysN/CysC
MAPSSRRRRGFPPDASAACGNGAFILIDRHTSRTVGAGMIVFGLRAPPTSAGSPLLVGKAERAALKRQ